MTDYYAKYADLINQQYNNAINGIDKSQEADKAIAKQQYQAQRNSAWYNAAQNSQSLKEMMAANGLSSSGDNITGNLNIMNNRNKTLSTINTNESNYNAQLAQEKYKQQMQYELARQEALLNAMKQNDEWGRQDKRYAIEDKRYDTEWQHQLNREGIEDKRYDTEWQHKLAREGVEDSQWEKEYALKKQQATSGYGGSYSRSGSGSSKSTTATVKNDIGNALYGAVANAGGSFDGIRAGYSWLNQNKDDIVDATSKTYYNDLKESLNNSYQTGVRIFRKSKSGPVYGGYE